MTFGTRLDDLERRIKNGGDPGTRRLALLANVLFIVLMCCVGLLAWSFT